MNGKQFIALLQARANNAPTPVDEERRTKIVEQWTQDYPFATIAKIDDGSVKLTRIDHNCPKCGDTLVDRSQFKMVGGEWIPRKTKGHLANDECLKCYPKGGAPLMMLMSCIKAEP